jgi:hypothetical protein
MAKPSSIMVEKNMNKSIAKIAELLAMDEPAARNFCLAVGAFFKHQPSYQQIAYVLRYYQDVRSDPEQAAHIIRRLISERGTRFAKQSVVKHKAGFSSEFASMVARRRKPYKKPLGVLDRSLKSRDPRDHVRTISKCAHGVVGTRKCAICDPAGWKRDNGRE